MVRSKRAGSLWICVALLWGAAWAAGTDDAIPPFGRDTVLVYTTQNQESVNKFVIRLAQFSPGRYLEWEDTTTQGTIYMTERAVKNAKLFLNSRLFEAGVDTRGKDSTTLWLSEKFFGELKQQHKARLLIDSIPSWVTLEGEDSLSVEVNRLPRKLPVIKVKDDRGSERWFLDSAENPLMVKHLFRAFSQTLVSITTDKPNTLRWIKGKKLQHPDE